MAYQTGAFSRATKVKPLSHYLGQIRRSAKGSVTEDALDFFKTIQARGIPVSIKRIPRETPAT